MPTPAAGNDDVVTPPITGRRFKNRDGRWWTVREVGPPDYDPGGPRSLVFCCDEDMGMWRVRNYPNGWAHLSDDELDVLSQRI